MNLNEALHAPQVSDYLNFWSIQQHSLTDVWFWINQNRRHQDLANELSRKTGNAYSYRRINDWKHWRTSDRKPPKIVRDIMRLDILIFLLGPQEGQAIYNILHC